jgi:hypothetical protein
VSDDAWTLRVAASAERQLARLPERIAAAVVEFLLGPLVENPRRVGHPLQRELAGLYPCIPLRFVHVDDSSVRPDVARAVWRG